MEDHNSHDHNPKTGECFLVEWKGAVEERERYEKREALTQEQIDRQRDEIKEINKINRAKVVENHKAPF